MTLYVNVLGAMFSGNTGDLDEFVVGMEVGAGLEAGASVRSRSYWLLVLQYRGSVTINFTDYSLGCYCYWIFMEIQAISVTWFAFQRKHNLDPIYFHRELVTIYLKSHEIFLETRHEGLGAHRVTTCPITSSEYSMMCNKYFYDYTTWHFSGTLFLQIIRLSRRAGNKRPCIIYPCVMPLDH